MFKKFRVAAVVAVTAFALTIGTSSLLADEKVKEVMKAAFKGKSPLSKTIPAAVKGEKWDDVKKLAAEFKEHGEALTKGQPAKGDAESWKKLTKKFAENTAAVAEAADKKDAKAVTTAMGKIGGSCMECHTAHR